MREGRGDAPGRINLIGEHTDYHEGYVMPCAIPQRTMAVLRTRSDRVVHASSSSAGCAPASYRLGEETRTGGWIDYVQGLTWLLRVEHGAVLSGFDLELQSDVPVGGGLSSSAALSVATLRALEQAFDLPLGDLDLARLAQRSEVAFVGAPVGIMDPMACSIARQHEALFIDTRSLAYERIPLPSTIEIAAIDSGLAHRHAGGGYVTRRRESEEAAAQLGVRHLRDVGPQDLARVESLPPTLARRARHVVTENARVLAAREALRRGDASALGALLIEGHASLRDDYEVSLPAIDRLVAIAAADPHVFGARLTGGGFGGAVIILVAAGSAAAVAESVRQSYARESGLTPTVLLPRR